MILYTQINVHQCYRMNGVLSKLILILVYTKFVLVRLCRKLFAYKNTVESVPGTNQYWEVVQSLLLMKTANDLSLTCFEPMRLAILGLLVQRINHSTTPRPVLVLIFEFGQLTYVIGNSHSSPAFGRC